MGRPATGPSAKPSKRRKLKRDLQSILRRKHYALRMKNPQARLAAQKYRKKYYARHAAILKKKAKATYEARKAEFKRRRLRLRAAKAKIEAKIMRKNEKLSKAANAGMKIPSNLKKATAKAKRGSRTGSILNQAKKGRKKK